MVAGSYQEPVAMLIELDALEYAEIIDLPLQPGWRQRGQTRGFSGIGMAAHPKICPHKARQARNAPAHLQVMAPPHGSFRQQDLGSRHHLDQLAFRELKLERAKHEQRIWRHLSRRSPCVSGSQRRLVCASIAARR
jgi:hypothetical protein